MYETRQISSPTRQEVFARANACMNFKWKHTVGEWLRASSSHTEPGPFSLKINSLSEEDYTKNKQKNLDFCFFQYELPLVGYFGLNNGGGGRGGALKTWSAVLVSQHDHGYVGLCVVVLHNTQHHLRVCLLQWNRKDCARAVHTLLLSWLRDSAASSFRQRQREIQINVSLYAINAAIAT